jgi:hypothetical protein
MRVNAIQVGLTATRRQLFARLTASHFNQGPPQANRQTPGLFRAPASASLSPPPGDVGARGASDDHPNKRDDPDDPVWVRRTLWVPHQRVELKLRDVDEGEGRAGLNELGAALKQMWASSSRGGATGAVVVFDSCHAASFAFAKRLLEAHAHAAMSKETLTPEKTASQARPSPNCNGSPAPAPTGLLSSPEPSSGVNQGVGRGKGPNAVSVVLVATNCRLRGRCVSASAGLQLAIQHSVLYFEVDVLAAADPADADELPALVTSARMTVCNHERPLCFAGERVGFAVYAAPALPARARPPAAARPQAAAAPAGHRAPHAVRAAFQHSDRHEGCDLDHRSHYDPSQGDGSGHSRKRRENRENRENREMADRGYA